MKKLLILGVIVAIAVFFSIPTFMFAETGDEYTALGDPPGPQ